MDTEREMCLDMEGKEEDRDGDEFNESNRRIKNRYRYRGIRRGRGRGMDG